MHSKIGGTGRTRSDTAAVEISKGGVCPPATSVFTVDEIQTIFLNDLRQQEENCSASGHLLSSGGNVNVENVETTPVAYSIPKTSNSQFVTDPYKSDFNPGDGDEASLYNKATEALKEADQFTFSQDKAANLLWHLKC